MNRMLAEIDQFEQLGLPTDYSPEELEVLE